MNLQKLKKMTPMQRLVFWIKEREAVRLKKEAGDPRPWTDDPIIGTYRFCNVRRMDDKVSKWLYENWYHPYFNHSNTLAAVALARFINKPESLSLITTEVYRAGRVNFNSIKTILRKHRDKGNVVFNGAYMVRGNDGQDKIECVVDHYVKPLTVNKGVIIDPSSMEKTWDMIHRQYGFGSFMAGQVVADLRWALNGTWRDKLTWAPIGPGSNRGMARLYNESFTPAYRQADFCSMLQDLMLDLKYHLPSSIYDRMEAHDFQNCLCEYDKFCRVILNEGKPKQLYREVT